MTHQTRAALKAHETLLYQWGPDEANRMARMAAWTGDNPTAPRDQNPHTREATYSADDRQRAGRFAQWRKAFPDLSHSENPHRHGAGA